MWTPATRGRMAKIEKKTKRYPGDLTAIALCLSVFASLIISGIAKEAFGRTWPESWLGDNPSWIRDGMYGFFPFHGGDGWESFPSGHTSAIATLATVLWVAWPKLRFFWV